MPPPEVDPGGRVVSSRRSVEWAGEAAQRLGGLCRLSALLSGREIPSHFLIWVKLGVCRELSTRLPCMPILSAKPVRWVPCSSV